MDHNYWIEGLIAVVWLLLSPVGFALLIAILLRWVARGVTRELSRPRPVTRDDLWRARAGRSDR